MVDFSGLVNPAAVGASIGNAFQQGMQQAEAYKTRSALQDYIKSPSEQAALNVATYNPMLGMQLQEREQGRAAAQQKQAAAQRQSQLQAAAAQGDPKALAELAGIDLDAWSKIGTAEKQALEKRVDYIGQAALRVSQLPAEQRAAAWDSYIAQGAQTFPDLAQYQGKYSPDALNAALAQAGQVKTFLELEKPDYRVIPEGGALVDVGNPRAVSAYSGAPQQPPQTAPQVPANVTAIIESASERGMMTPEEAETVKAGLGANGQAAFNGWLTNQGIKIAKTVNGQNFYLVNGKWYDNPEGR